MCGDRCWVTSLRIIVLTHDLILLDMPYGIPENLEPQQGVVVRVAHHAQGGNNYDGGVRTSCCSSVSVRMV